MNAFLTPELEKFVGKKVESGLYNSASGVICEGSRRLNELRLQNQSGINKGETQPLSLSDVIERGQQRYAQRQKTSS